MFDNQLNYRPKFGSKSPCIKFGDDPGSDPPADPPGGGGGVAVLDKAGNFTEDFYNTFDESDRAAISRYKTPNSLGKGHLDLRRTFDKPADRVLVMLDENSTEEEITAFNQRLGVPQDATGYEFELNPELQNITVDDDKLNAFRAIAKESGIPKSKFNGLVNSYLALIDKEAGDFDLIQQNNEAKSLEEDNGIADKYFGQSKDERIARADMLLRKYGNIEIKNEKGEVVANAVEKLLERYPRMKHDPYLTMIIDGIAEDMSPERLKGLGGVTTLTNAAISVKVAEIRNNPAYTDVSHPDYKRLNAEVLELYKKMKA